MPEIADLIEFTRDIPPIDTLRTGDVLFPRKVKRHEDRYTVKERDRRRKAEDSSLNGFVEALYAGVPDAEKSPDESIGFFNKLMEMFKPKGTNEDAPFGDGLTSKQQLDVLRIFKVEFEHFIPHWFGGLSAKEFFKIIPSQHPIAKLLLEAMSDSRSEGFFIGHSALVICNNENADDAYVIEANVSDFAHYGVAIHPYFCSSDLDANGLFAYDNPTKNEYPSKLMRGWVNRRVAMGEQVWHQRHLFFENTTHTEQQKTLLRTALTQQAKPLLGRSYSILDSATYGNSNRLYCFEFIDYVYKQAVNQTGTHVPDLRLDDQRTWEWLWANLADPSPFRAKFKAAFMDYTGNGDPVNGSVWDKVKVSDCPVFTAHMLFKSENLKLKFNPKSDKKDPQTDAYLDEEYVQ